MRFSNLNRYEPDSYEPDWEQSWQMPAPLPGLPPPGIAAPMASQPPQLAPTDLWAPVRKLASTSTRIPQFDANWVAPEQAYDPENPFGNLQLPPVLKDAQGADLFQDVNWVDSYSSNWSSPELKPFQSKFGETQSYGNGIHSIKMQQPGGHKYDLANVFYREDPKTGAWNMIGDPQTFKQQSGKTEFGQAVGATLGPILAMAGLGPLAGLLGGGSLGAIGAGAIMGGGVPAISGGNSSEVLSGALRGGLGAGTVDFLRADLPSGMDLAGDGGANSIDAAASQFRSLPPLPMLDVPSFNPEDLFSGMADPTNALQELPEVGQLPGQMPPPGVLAPLPADVPSAFDDYIRMGASDASTVGGNGGYAGSIFGDPELTGIYDTPTVSGLPPLPYEQTVNITTPPQGQAQLPSNPFASIPAALPQFPPGSVPPQEPPVNLPPEAPPVPEVPGQSPPYKDLAKLLMGTMSKMAGSYSAPAVSTALRSHQWDTSLPKMFDPNYRKPQMKAPDVY